MHYFPKYNAKKTDTTGLGRVGQGSDMRGVLLLPSSLPALSPVYDGLDVKSMAGDTECPLQVC